MSLKIRVEECEECGKSEEFKGSYDDCHCFCRDCFEKIPEEDLDELCYYCSGCDDDPCY